MTFKYLKIVIDWHIDCFKHIDEGGGLYYFGLSILIATLLLNWIYH
jgi:hypothetical protein